MEVVKEDVENAVAGFKRAIRTDPSLGTAIGFDKLKQYIGRIKDSQRYGSPEWKVASDVYNSIRNTIAKQEPSYAKAMKDYEAASDQLEQITKTLSLGKKASDDTALRKLLSSTRSDVNTNFGQRQKLVEELNKRDPSIVPGLAGQAYAPLVPGGLAGAGAGGMGAWELGSLIAGHGLNPSVLAAIASTSPRLWGEIALAAGRGARKVKDLTPEAVQQVLSYHRPATEAALAARAAGAPGRLRVDVGTGEVTDAPQ